MKKLLLKTRTAILIFLTHKIALPLLKIFRSPNQFTYNMAALKLLPKGSLGNDLFLFLEKRKLPLLNHYARHDLKHVLLGYDTTDEGEACLQSFMLGNSRVSFPVLATVLYSFVTMPEYWKKMKQAYRLGKSGHPVHCWSWNDLLPEQTEHLKLKIFRKS